MIIGGEPIAFFNGGAEAPYGTFELDIVGGIRGKAVECVAGKITSLPSSQCRNRPRRLSA